MQSQQRSRNVEDLKPMIKPQNSVPMGGGVLRRDAEGNVIVPAFKLVGDFIVDGFRFKNEFTTTYFLTHFHSDHYVGLTKTFSYGTIYCTPITKRLVEHKIGVSARYLQEIPLNAPTVIDGVTVTFYDANHCPGAAIILFQFTDGSHSANGKVVKNVLHCGDFRYIPEMKLYPRLRDCQEMHELYLDTTFCHPKHSFPKQKECIETIVEIVKELWSQRTCFLVGTYLIGKERVAIALAKALGVKIHASAEKLLLFQMMDLDMSLFTSDFSRIQIVSMGSIRPSPQMDAFFETIKNQYDRVIAFRPTGWSFKGGGASDKRATSYTSKYLSVYAVPYSEHSSFEELRECVRWLKPKKIIPTVDCETKDAVERQVKFFSDLMDYSTNKNTLVPFLQSGVNLFQLSSAVSTSVSLTSRSFSSSSKSSSSIESFLQRETTVITEAATDDDENFFNLSEDENDNYNEHDTFGTPPLEFSSSSATTTNSASSSTAKSTSLSSSSKLSILEPDPLDLSWGKLDAATIAHQRFLFQSIARREKRKIVSSSGTSGRKSSKKQRRKKRKNS